MVRNRGKSQVSAKRGYYRIPRKSPANRIYGPLEDAVRAKFAEGWPKARIAREFRLNRRTVIRICTQRVPNPRRQRPVGPNAKQLRRPVNKFLRPSFIPEAPVFVPLIRCIGCGITIRRSIMRAHWPNCPAVREGHLSLEDCPV